MIWLLFILLLLLGGGDVPAQGLFTAPPNSSSRSFTPLHTYFMAATGCNDTNPGTSAGAPWCTPNHSMVCGDVIVAAAGNYSSIFNSGFNWGTVSNCPSTTGGIDGAGGIYFATLLCGGADLEACPIVQSVGGTALAVMDTNNWAMEGFKINGGTSTGLRSFECRATASGTTIVHHIAIINNVSFNSRAGFDTNDGVLNHNVPGNGCDYLAVVGNIAQNSAQDTICLAAIDIVAPSFLDTNAGTHFLVYGNFSYNNTNTCASDVEDYMFDTFDAHGVTNDAVMLNNVGWTAYRFGLQVFMQSFNSVNGLHMYIENNTLYNSNRSGNVRVGELNFQLDMNVGVAPTVLSINNIGLATSSGGCGHLVGGANGPGTLANVTVGTLGNENVLFNNGGGGNECPFNGFSFGTNNFQVDPAFANLSDLTTNRSGTPNCTGFINVTQCMGYNAVTSVLTTLSPVGDLQASCTNCGGKGYQKPSITCVSSGPYHDLYPIWLKGIVYLHWTGSAVVQNFDLVTLRCGM